MSTLSAENIVEICLSEPYAVVLERYGLSFPTYLAVRRDRRFPPRNNFHRRNMDVRQRIVNDVRVHPERTYRDVANALSLPLTCVWKIFTDYMLHDAAMRVRVSK